MRHWALVAAGLLVAAAMMPTLAEEKEIGLKVGEGTPAYNPIHVAGPDKGTNTCPV